MAHQQLEGLHVTAVYHALDVAQRMPLAMLAAEPLPRPVSGAVVIDHDLHVLEVLVVDRLELLG